MSDQNLRNNKSPIKQNDKTGSKKSSRQIITLRNNFKQKFNKNQEIKVEEINYFFPTFFVFNVLSIQQMNLQNDTAKIDVIIYLTVCYGNDSKQKNQQQDQILKLLQNQIEVEFLHRNKVIKLSKLIDPEHDIPNQECQCCKQGDPDKQTFEVTMKNRKDKKELFFEIRAQLDIHIDYQCYFSPYELLQLILQIRILSIRKESDPVREVSGLKKQRKNYHFSLKECFIKNNKQNKQDKQNKQNKQNKFDRNPQNIFMFNQRKCNFQDYKLSPSLSYYHAYCEQYTQKHKYQNSDWKRSAIISYINSKTINVCKIWYEWTAKIEIKDPCIKGICYFFLLFLSLISSIFWMIAKMICWFSVGIISIAQNVIHFFIGQIFLYSTYFNQSVFKQERYRILDQSFNQLIGILQRKLYYQLIDHNKQLLIKYLKKANKHDQPISIQQYKKSVKQITQLARDPDFNEQNIGKEMQDIFKNNLNFSLEQKMINKFSKKVKQSNDQIKSRYLSQNSVIKPFNYAYAVICLYKQPTKQIYTIFIPLIFLSIINLSIYLQAGGISERGETITTLALTLFALVPVIRESTPKKQTDLFVDKLIKAQIMLGILVIIQSMLRSSDDPAPEKMFLTDNYFFLVSFAYAIILVIIIVTLYLIFWKNSKRYERLSQNQFQERVSNRYQEQKQEVCCFSCIRSISKQNFTKKVMNQKIDELKNEYRLLSATDADSLIISTSDKTDGYFKIDSKGNIQLNNIINIVEITYCQTIMNFVYNILSCFYTPKLNSQQYAERQIKIKNYERSNLYKQTQRFVWQNDKCDRYIQWYKETQNPKKIQDQPKKDENSPTFSSHISSSLHKPDQSSSDQQPQRRVFKRYNKLSKCRVDPINIKPTPPLKVSVVKRSLKVKEEVKFDIGPKKPIQSIQSKQPQRQLKVKEEIKFDIGPKNPIQPIQPSQPQRSLKVKEEVKFDINPKKPIQPIQPIQPKQPQRQLKVKEEIRFDIGPKKQPQRQLKVKEEVKFDIGPKSKQDQYILDGPKPGSTPSKPSTIIQKQKQLKQYPQFAPISKIRAPMSKQETGPRNPPYI